MADSLVGLDSGGCVAALANGSVGQVMTIGADGKPAWINSADDQTAAEVTFTPYLSLAATSVQGAIQEIVDECCHEEVTVDATSNPALTVATGQVAKLDLSLMTGAGNCGVPVRIVGADNLSYAFADLWGDPESHVVAMADFYRTAANMPGFGTQQGATGANLTLTNNTCRPRLARFTMQAWAFFNFLPPLNGAYLIYVSDNGAPYALDHGVQLSDPHAADNGAAAGANFKSYYSKSVIIPASTSYALAVRVDFTINDLGIAIGTWADTGFLNATLVGELF